MSVADSESAHALLAQGRLRVCVENVTPTVDGGRFPVKRIVGDTLLVEADVFSDGHERVAAAVSWGRPGVAAHADVPMERIGASDRFRGQIELPHPGRHAFAVKGWIDRFGTWRADLAKRVDAGQDVDVDLRIGAALVADAAFEAADEDRQRLGSYAELLRSDEPAPLRVDVALGEDLDAIMRRCDPRRFVTRSRELTVVVDRERARFSAWYELFPRSAGSAGKHGTLRDVIGRLPYIASMGFDVLYLPPIHPIGTTHRKGPNNDPHAAEGDVGSPWAIGTAQGGHTAIHPALGTFDDFEALRSAAAEHGIELALDIAFQASPDHPWVQEHPQFFRHRPDGTVQHAENPPKVYQDIYPLDFETEAWTQLWEELRSVFAFWADRGVRIFRVDNPHTKALRFWEWCIAALKERYPDVLFLSEAFTRPCRMYRLAKAGFSQSYTYFTWRNTAHELQTYFEQLVRPPLSDFLRPNLWPNTPDILPEYLQIGGRPAFAVRLVLAATLGSSYGIYGPAFELCENRPVREGSEEYLDSEKYQLRRWNLEAEHTLRELIARVNRIRRENPALQRTEGLRFCTCDNDQLVAFVKETRKPLNTIVVVVNLDPNNPQSGWVTLPAPEAGRAVQMHDLLSGDRFLWSGERHFVRLDPAAMPAHVFRVRHRVRTEHDFDYFA